MLPGITPVPGLAKFEANAVAFDGTNDYLTRGADLTGVSDGKLGILSLWVDFTGGDGVFNYFCNTATATFRFFAGKSTGNVLIVVGRNAAGTVILTLNGTGTVNAAGGWHHVLASWDLVAGAAHLYLDDADDEGAGTLTTNDNIDYTEGEFSIGGDAAAGFKLNADAAEVYINLAEFLDFSVVANRRKFISSNLKPVFLGSDGSIPTGSAPAVFLTNPTATWHTNAGAGGDFTENGALADAGSSPSD